MPAHRFIAFDAEGRKLSGTVDADSARAARSQLRAQGLIPMEVVALAASDQGQADAFWSRWLAPRGFNASTLAVWARQMAGLLGAGLPLERALASLAEESDSELQRQVNAALRSVVNEGGSFASAMAQQPREFPALMVAVVEAGEHSGRLHTVLERVADDMEARQALRAQLTGAALYPAIVSAVAVLIVLFLLAYVLPQVAAVFQGTRQSLPWLTVAMLAASDLVRSYGAAILLVLVLAALALRRALVHQDLRLRWDAAWLRVPVLGRMLRDYNAARFASTLALLVGAGVPILRALQGAADTVGNLRLRRDVAEALVLVREGAPLAAALAQGKRLPGLLVTFARLGEQTGHMPDMLDRAADQLGAGVRQRAMRWATLLEPLLIVAMGAVVLLIVLAVLMPIVQLNQWVH